MVGIWEMTEGPIKKLGFLEKKKKEIDKVEEILRQ